MVPTVTTFTNDGEYRHVGDNLFRSHILGKVISHQCYITSESYVSILHAT